MVSDAVHGPLALGNGLLDDGLVESHLLKAGAKEVQGGHRPIVVSLVLGHGVLHQRVQGIAEETIEKMAQQMQISQLLLLKSTVQCSERSDGRAVHCRLGSRE